jgi:hypothetical protein
VSKTGFACAIDTASRREWPLSIRTVHRRKLFIQKVNLVHVLIEIFPTIDNDRNRRFRFRKVDELLHPLSDLDKPIQTNLLLPASFMPNIETTSASQICPLDVAFDPAIFYQDFVRHA